MNKEILLNIDPFTLIIIIAVGWIGFNTYYHLFQNNNKLKIPTIIQTYSNGTPFIEIDTLDYNLKKFIKK